MAMRSAIVSSWVATSRAAPRRDGVQNQVEEMLCSRAVQLTCRFVCKNQSWPADERPRHGDTLGLAAGEFFRQLVGKGRLLEPAEKFSDLCIRVVVVSEKHERQADILGDGKGRKQAWRLKCESHLSRPKFSFYAQRRPGDFAARRIVQAA